MNKTAYTLTAYGSERYDPAGVNRPVAFLELVSIHDGGPENSRLVERDNEIVCVWEDEDGDQIEEVVAVAKSQPNKPRQIKLTDNQNNVLNAILKRTNETYATLIRRLLAAEADKHDLKFPQDASTNDIKKAQAARWPKRPAPGEIVTLVIGETEFTGEKRSVVAIEEADAIVSDLLGEETQMRFNEDVRRDGAAPHTMRGSYIWVEPAE